MEGKCFSVSEEDSLAPGNVFMYLPGIQCQKKGGSVRFVDKWFIEILPDYRKINGIIFVEDIEGLII